MKSPTKHLQIPPAARFAAALPVIIQQNVWSESSGFFKTLEVYVQTLASEAKWKKIYIYIHRNLESHPGDTYPSKAAIFFLLLAVHLSLQNCWIHLEREIEGDQKTGIKNCSHLHRHMWILYFLYGCVIDCYIT